MMERMIRAAETDRERDACYRIRETVFVEEQKVPPWEELDAEDETADHFLAVEDAGLIYLPDRFLFASWPRASPESTRWHRLPKGAPSPASCPAAEASCLADRADPAVRVARTVRAVLPVAGRRGRRADPAG